MKLNFNTEDASNYLSSLTATDAVQKTHGNKYAETYRGLVRLAASTQDDPQHDGASALACASYGWMPTIMRSFSPERFGVDSPIAEIKAVASFDEAEAFLATMEGEPPVNNSWVGTSKFLHFLNPAFFPIWDARVSKNFGTRWIMWNEEKIGTAPTLHYFTRSRHHYIQYVSFMHAEVAKNHRWLEPVSNELQTQYHYRPTHVRSIEVMLFERFANSVIVESSSY